MTVSVYYLIKSSKHHHKGKALNYYPMEKLAKETEAQDITKLAQGHRPGKQD